MLPAYARANPDVDDGFKSDFRRNLSPVGGQIPL